MAEAQSEDDIRALLEGHLLTAQELCNKCEQLKHVKGIHKMLKKCKAELKFLQSISQRRDLKASHVKSSNLTHLQGILDAAETLPGVVQVLQPFYSTTLCCTLVVDVVCNHGYNWVKVVARNAQALHLRWAGDGQFGERNIVEQAAEFVECRGEHLHNYRAPGVVFIFTGGVTKPLQEAMERLGVLVHGTQVEVSEDVLRQLTDPAQAVHCLTGVCTDGFCVCQGSDSDEEIPSASELFKTKVTPQQPVKTKSQTTQPQAATNTPPGGDSLNNKPELAATPSGGDSANDQLDIATTTPSGDNLQNNELKLVMEKSVLEEEDDEPASYDCDRNLPASDLKLFAAVSESLAPSGTVCESLAPSAAVSESVAPSAAVCDSLAPSGAVSDLFVSNLQLTSQEDVKKVNLDITTLISLVSNACHGRCNFVFKESVLSEQAAQERNNPLLPRLYKFFEGKELYACKTAMDNFCTVLYTVGGTEERKRAEKMFKRMTVVDDQPSDRAMTLQTRSRVKAKVKDRAKIIFGTGDSLQAITASANVAFIRSARNQGVTFAVFTHEPRVLTEQKEKHAKPLDEKSL